MTNPYRAMCAELVEAYAWCIEEYMTAPAEEDSLIQRARALLAQPVAEGPTDDDLRGIFYRFCDSSDDGPSWIESEAFIQAARAVLAKWGHQ